MCCSGNGLQGHCSSCTYIILFLEDIDECEEMISGCNQLCVNTIGFFECLCQNGYKLLNDNRTCDGKCTLFGIDIHTHMPHRALYARDMSSLLTLHRYR